MSMEAFKDTYRPNRLAMLLSTVDGISLSLHGVQGVRSKELDTGAEAVGVDLPRYRSPDSTWRWL